MGHFQKIIKVGASGKIICFEAKKRSPRKMKFWHFLFSKLYENKLILGIIPKIHLKKVFS